MLHCRIITCKSSQQCCRNELMYDKFRHTASVNHCLNPRHWGGGDRGEPNYTFYGFLLNGKAFSMNFTIRRLADPRMEVLAFHTTDEITYFPLARLISWWERTFLFVIQVWGGLNLTDSKCQNVIDSNRVIWRHGF